jgi:type I restriction enzyme R subunit
MMWFVMFTQAEQQREVQELINNENLNAEATKRSITIPLKRECASENGTQATSVALSLPLDQQELVVWHVFTRNE